jgi:LysM repeat protein
VELPGRAQLARFAAPAAFLAAVTVAVLLVRAGLAGSDGAGGTTLATGTVATTSQSTGEIATTETTTTAKPVRRYYRVEAGDTYAIIAAKFNTTVEQLLALNPGVDPKALRIGQRIRVA